MPPLSILIKPTSSRCNLKCQYCFYEDESLHRFQRDYGFMKIEDLEVIIKKALNVATGSCSFLFQGGEPTLVGLTFYEQVIHFQQLYNVSQVKITNSIQTNGLVIDKSWSQFFKKHEFLVGISLDGIEKTHEYYRGKNFKRVMQAVNLLQQDKVNFNILTVVTDEVATYAEEIYSFYKEHDFKYLQFIPCLDSLESQSFLSVDHYATFLKIFFNCWFDDVMKGRCISIGYFDDLLKILCGQYPITCGRLGRCGRHYVLESNGSVYPCDFYMMDPYYLGNLLQDDFKDLDEKRRDLNFLKLEKSNQCLNCQWYRLCYGGCKREEGSDRGRSKYCQAYQTFFEYAYPKLRWLANRILERS